MIPSVGQCDRFEIQGIRQFREKVEVQFDQINILIGTNGSGKSTFLRLLRLFHDVVLLKELDHIPTDLLHRHDLVTEPEGPIHVGFDVSLKAGWLRYQLKYEVEPNFSWRLKSMKAHWVVGGEVIPFLSVLDYQPEIPVNAIRPQLIWHSISRKLKEPLVHGSDQVGIDFIRLQSEDDSKVFMPDGVNFLEALLATMESQQAIIKNPVPTYDDFIDPQPRRWYDVVTGMAHENTAWIINEEWKASYFDDSERYYLKEVFSEEQVPENDLPLFWLCVATFHECSTNEHRHGVAEFIQNYLGHSNPRVRNAFLRSVLTMLQSVHETIGRVLLIERTPHLFVWSRQDAKSVGELLVLKPQDLGRLTGKHASLHQKNVLNQILIKWLSTTAPGFLERHSEHTIEREWKSEMLDRKMTVRFDFLSGDFEMLVEDKDGNRPLSELSSGEQRGCFLELLLNASVQFFLEEPENSLHPAVQEELGKLLINTRFMNIAIEIPGGGSMDRVVYITRPPLFIETHSDHLLVGMQRAIAELNNGAITTHGSKMGGVQILEFQQYGKEHARVESITMSTEGESSKILSAEFYSRTSPTIKFLRGLSN